MRSIRVIGNTIKKIAKEKNVPVSVLAESIECDENKFALGLAGRSMFSFPQLELIANKLGITIDLLVPGDEDSYNAAYVDCMNTFSNIDNMDKILDIVYDYLDVLDEVESNSV